MYYKKELGEIGENIATEYIRKKGYDVIIRNFRCRQGEIDIIAKDEDEFIFIEVKTRTNKEYGFAAEAVDVPKEKHIKQAIKYYIYINQLENNFIRIDVIEIYLDTHMKKAYINHIKQAF